MYIELRYIIEAFQISTIKASNFYKFEQFLA